MLIYGWAEAKRHKQDERAGGLQSSVTRRLSTSL